MYYNKRITCLKNGTSNRGVFDVYLQDKICNLAFAFQVLDQMTRMIPSDIFCSFQPRTRQHQSKILLRKQSVFRFIVQLSKFIWNSVFWLTYSSLYTSLADRVFKKYVICNISNTKASAWPHFQTPRRELKIWRVGEYILRNFEVFGNVVKHWLECVIYLHNKN